MSTVSPSNSDPLEVMDQLERLVLAQGWPVPFTPYYMVHHEDMLLILDRLRASLRSSLHGDLMSPLQPFAHPTPENSQKLSAAGAFPPVQAGIRRRRYGNE